MSEEKKRREAAENEKQELQDRLKAFEEERERQAKQLEETLSKTQELEQKAAVSGVLFQNGSHLMGIAVSVPLVVCIGQWYLYTKYNPPTGFSYHKIEA